MSSREELEQVSRIIDGELPADERLAPERARMEVLLAAAATLPVSLSEPELAKLINRALTPPAQSKRRWWVVAAVAVAALIIAWFWSPASTRLDSVTGSVAVNGHLIASSVDVPSGAIVETGADSAVTLVHARYEVTLASNSRAALGESLELLSGVACLESSTDERVRVAGTEVVANGKSFIIAEPADEVVRVTERLAHQSTNPEVPVRTLLLSLAVPAVSLGAVVSPSVFVSAGVLTVTPDGEPSRALSAGDRWSAPMTSRPAAAPGSDVEDLKAQLAALREEQTALRKRVDELSRAAPGTPGPTARTNASALAVRGTVVDSLGRPAANVEVVMFAGDQLSESASTDAEGRFSLDPPAGVAGVVYAHTDGRSALSQSVQPGANLALKLAESGKIQLRVLVNGQPVTGAHQAWTAAAGVATRLPGVFGGLVNFTGDHAQLTRPAGELMLHLVNEADPRFGAHVRLKVEPGLTTAVTVELQPAEARVIGRVVNATTRKAVRGYQISLLLPDDSVEAAYTVNDPGFGFSHRTAGERVLLITAEGFKPLRKRVTLEPNTSTDTGPLALEPL